MTKTKTKMIRENKNYTESQVMFSEWTNTRDRYRVNDRYELHSICGVEFHSRFVVVSTEHSWNVEDTATGEVREYEIRYQAFGFVVRHALTTSQIAALELPAETKVN